LGHIERERVTYFTALPDDVWVMAGVQSLSSGAEPSENISTSSGSICKNLK
jgi:hypothetical protein